MDYGEKAARFVFGYNEYSLRRTRWFVRIPEREKEYSRYKWEMSLSRLDCIKRIANANVLLQSLGEPELMCYCSVIEFSEEMSLDILVRVVDPCKWVVSVGAYQITIHGSPRKFLIHEGIMEDNFINKYRLVESCDKILEKNRPIAFYGR